MVISNQINQNTTTWLGRVHIILALHHDKCYFRQLPNNFQPCHLYSDDTADPSTRKPTLSTNHAYRIYRSISLHQSIHFHFTTYSSLCSLLSRVIPSSTTAANQSYIAVIFPIKFRTVREVCVSMYTQIYIYIYVCAYVSKLATIEHISFVCGGSSTYCYLFIVLMVVSWGEPSTLTAVVADTYSPPLPLFAFSLYFILLFF